MDHAQYNPERRARNNQESKYTLAGWIFRRIPIKRLDRFLPVPTALGTRARMESPLVKQVIEFERWMRTTTYIERSGQMY